MSLDKIIINKKINNDNLFLAAEQGTRKYKSNANTVIYSKTRLKS